MSKKIEYSYIVHILILVFGIVLLRMYFNIDAFEIFENGIENAKEYTLSDIETSINNFKENPEIYNMTEMEISEYRAHSIKLVEEAYYYMHYFMPAILLLIVLGIVLLENAVYRSMKLSWLCASYDAKKDVKKEKLKAIIREKIDYKYRRIYMPKHVPIMCMILYTVTMLDLSSQAVLERVLENILFALIVMLTIFGIRVAIKIFKTKNELLRFIVVVSNVILGFMVPQMYFVIGFLKSLMTVKIIIKTN